MPVPLQEGRQSPLSLQAHYSFDRFITGPENELTAAACQAAAAHPGRTYNPLFIHGAVGLGKTHLLHAIGNAAYRFAPEKRIRYVTSERFAIELISAIRGGHTESFRQAFRTADILLIDDVHFLPKKESFEEELFHTFNALYDGNRQIVLSSDRPPEELAELQDRLISRFRGGMVTDIQPPQFETRLAILTAKAREMELGLDREALSLIASRINSSVRALEGALIRISAYRELQASPVTIERVSELVIPEPVTEWPLDVERIKREVAQEYGVEVTALEGKKRDKLVTQARHIAMYLVRDMLDRSYPAIGHEFGGRDHTSVMHACRKVSDLLDTPLFRGEIDRLKRKLQQPAPRSAQRA